MINNSAISLKKITKAFKIASKTDLKVLSDITLDIKQGEFFVFLGPSGSGKSTLLRIMSGLDSSYNGTIKFASGIKESDIGFIFQNFALLPWLTVRKNVELGLISRHLPKEEVKRISTAELKRFGLANFADSPIKDLSGGMRQRVGIARALATNPKVLFMDEPFSELDSFTAEELRKELLSIWQEKKITVIMVTHIIDEAIELADRIAVLTPRPGKIEGIVDIPLSRPRQKRSPEFFTLEDELYKLVQP